MSVDVSAGDESRDPSARLRYAIENTFPAPIARPFYQLRGVDDWQAEDMQLAKTLGAALEYLAILALSQYLAGNTRNKELDDTLLTRLRQPLSYGHWIGLLRDVMAFIRAHQETVFIPEFVATYFPSGTGKSSPTFASLADQLVALRNEEVKRSPDHLPTRQMHRRFKHGLVEFLRGAAFVKDYPPIAVVSTETEQGIKSHHARLLIGCRDPFDTVRLQTDLDLEKGRVAVLSPHTPEVLYLYPFYLLHECAEPGCESTHLFRFDKLDKKGVNYSAANDHRLHDLGAAGDLVRLFDHPEAIRLRLTGNYLHFDSPDHWQELPPGYRFRDTYEVVQHLRWGGQAAVYKVRRLSDDALLALKLLPFQSLSYHVAVQRFLREAQQAKQLAHQTSPLCSTTAKTWRTIIWLWNWRRDGQLPTVRWRLMQVICPYLCLRPRRW